METGTYVPRTFAEKATDPIAFGSYMVIGITMVVLAITINYLFWGKKSKKEEETTVWTKEHGEEKLSDHYKRIGKKK